MYFLSNGNRTPVITCLSLDLHTFRLSYTYSGMNCVQKLGTACMEICHEICNCCVVSSGVV